MQDDDLGTVPIICGISCSSTSPMDLGFDPNTNRRLRKVIWSPGNLNLHRDRAKAPVYPINTPCPVTRKNLALFRLGVNRNWSGGNAAESTIDDHVVCAGSI